MESSTQGSPLHRAQDPHWWWRDLTNNTFVDIMDVLRAIQAFTPKPDKNVKFPKRTLRPWEEDNTKFGTATPVDELEKYLDQWAAGTE